MTKRIISIVLTIFMTALLVATFATTAFAATVSFEINPIVFLGGGDEYNIVWRTNVTSIGYVTYTVNGTTYTVYDEQNGVVRTDDNMHTVRIPQAHLDSAGSYTVVSKEVTSRSGYNINLGNSVQTTQNFIGYDGSGDVTFAAMSDTHFVLSTKSQTFSFAKNLMETTHADADVIILNGDISGDSLQEKASYDALFEFMYVVSSNGQKPVLFVVGNHEKRGFYSKELEKYLVYDTGEFYGRIDYGPASMIVLDSGEDKEDTVINYGHDGTAGLVDFNHYFDEQIEWAKSMGGYRADAEYTFSVSHSVEPFCTLYRNADIRKPLKEYGTHFVIGGHTHGLTHRWQAPNYGTLPYPGLIVGLKDGTGFSSSSITCKDGSYTIKRYNKSGSICSCENCITYGNGEIITYTPPQTTATTYTAEATQQTVQATQQTTQTQSTTQIATAYGLSTTAVKSASATISQITKPVVFDCGYYYSVVWQTTSGIKCGGYVEVAGDTSYWNGSHGGKLRTETTHSVRIPKSKLAGKTYTVKNRTIGNYNAYGFYNGADVEYGEWVSAQPITMAALPNDSSSKFTALAVANKTGGKTAATELLSKYSTTPNLLVMLGDMAPALDTEADFGKYILEYAAEVTGGKYPVVFCRGEGESKGAFAANVSRFIRVFTGDGAMAGFNTDYAYGSNYSFIALDTATKNKDSFSGYKRYAKFDTIRQKQTTWLEQISGSINCNYNLVFANADNLSNCVGVNFAQNFKNVGTHLVVAAGSGSAKFTKGGHAYSQANVGDALGLVLTCANNKIKVESINSSTTTLGEVDTKTTNYIYNHTYTADFDTTSHWQVCTICGEKNNIVTHGFDNACDTTCNGCNYVRETAHNYQIKHDDTSHFEECSVCGDKTNIKEQSIKNVSAKAPTCEKIGWDAYKYCENCDYSTYVEKSATGHSLKNVDAKAKTCTTVGWNAYEYCEDCDHTTYVEIPASHEFINVNAKDKTCTEDGYTAHKECKDCGEIIGKVVIPAGHGNYVQNKDDKEHWLECEDCQDKKDIVEHSFDNACDTTCNGCDFTRVTTHHYEQTHDDTNHWDECTVCHDKINVQSANYVQKYDGTKHWNECSVCNDVVEETTHSIKQADAKPKTCTEDGWEAYDYCEGCDYSAKVIIPAGHGVYVPDYDDTHHFDKCVDCGDKQNIVEHSFDNACDTTCNGCEFTRETEHNHEAKFDTEKHWKECTKCGDKIDEVAHIFENDCDTDCSGCDFTRVTEHNYEKTHDDTNHWEECTVCHDKINVQSANYVQKYDGTKHWNECSVCHSKVNEATHTIHNVGEQASTCTEDGWDAYEYCEHCDYTTYVKRPAGHKLQDVDAKDKTCDQDGYTAHKACTECDYKDDAYQVIPASHELINVDAKGKTCINDGYTAHKACTECDYKEGYELIPAGHTLYKVAGKDKRCAQDGWTPYQQCYKCDYNTKVIIPAGHQLVNVDAKAKTCTTAGWNAYEYCQDCNYTTKVEIPASHNIKQIAAKAKTCTENGYTAHKACADCGYTEGKQIIAKGHSLSDYVYNGDATTSADGTKTRRCLVCGYNETIVAAGTKLPAPLPAPEQQPQEKPIQDTTQIFDDVEQTWYTSYVNYAYTHGVFKGNPDGTFKPLSNITRAEFVQVLANITGINTADKLVATRFSDVNPGDWYAPAIKWASESNIVSGLENNRFGPEQNITREQMCVMIVNYAQKYKGITLAVVEAKEAFYDDGAISSWAKDAVYTCQMADIVNGKGEGRFDPQGTGLRAEASVIFSKFHQSYLSK